MVSCALVLTARGVDVYRGPGEPDGYACVLFTRVIGNRVRKLGGRFAPDLDGAVNGADVLCSVLGGNGGPCPYSVSSNQFLASSETYVYPQFSFIDVPIHACIVERSALPMHVAVGSCAREWLFLFEILK